MNIVEIERALIKRYRSRLYSPFVRAINDYQLIQENDVIACCISGGKDSLVCAKLFQELKRHGKFNFDVKYLVMNPGFNQENLDALIKNANTLNIPIKIKNSDIFSVSSKLNSENPCYLCAKMRRGFLYDFAIEEGCNKIALGHHFDDIIETTLLNLIYSGTFKTMPPKLKSTNHPGMELIRPLAYIKENDIKAYLDYCEVKAMNCGCKVSSGQLPSKRKYVKNLIKELKLDYKDSDKSIFNAASNINLNCCMGWTYKGKKISFLDEYDE